MKKENLKGKTVTLKLKNVNFEVKTRAMTVPYAVATVDEIFAVAKDLLKTEIDNESPQPLRLRLMGVRISAFVSADDKKPLQKSILGFLQPGKAGSSGLTQGANQNLEKENLSDYPSQTLTCPPLMQKYKQNEVPVWKKQRLLEGNQTSEEPKQSFFHRAHAERLKIQAANAKTQEEEHEENTSAIPSTGLPPHNHEEASTEAQKESSALSDESENECFSRVEACASTSGCGGKATETLTCPVCFQRVETADLNVFNKHIDQCLSDPSSKPNQCSISESDSDIESQRDQKGGDVGDKSSGECAIVKATNSKALESNTDVPRDEKICIKNNSKTALLIKYENKTMTSQQSQTFNEKGSILICPVCQLTQDSDDLVIFNHHVDLCLNQPVLHKLRGWTSSPMIPPSVENKTTGRGHILPTKANKGKSKRRDTPSSPPSKKAKGAGPLNTIDKFFR